MAPLPSARRAAAGHARSADSHRGGAGPHPRLRHCPAPAADLARGAAGAAGSLYPALHRLEKRGLLRAEWKASETGREAKFYRLSRSGRAALAEETANWTRLAEAVGLILRLVPGEAS
ncbi:MAG TPA: helix-turn-helix transcriptional regulator [Terriglobales bacterium]|nr:helix-turn-helix transcriptional regulator [Terriglobales bacterium]